MYLLEDLQVVERKLSKEGDVIGIIEGDVTVQEVAPIQKTTIMMITPQENNIKRRSRNRNQKGKRKEEK
jgi:hypothetical protein